MTKRRKLVLLSCLAATIAAAVGAASATAFSTAKKSTILIGVDMPLTGSLAPIGVSQKNGIVLAAKQINAKGGINGHKIRLDIRDDTSSPTGVSTNVSSLIAEGAYAVLGPTGGPLVPTATAITNRAKVLSFVGGSSDLAGTTTGPTIFQMVPRLSLWGDAMACYVQKGFKAKTAAILYSTDPSGQQVSDRMTQDLPKLGIKIVDKESAELGATDTSVQWTKIKAANPDVVVDDMTSSAGGLTIKTARSLGIKTPVIGFISWAQPSILALAGSAANGAIVAGVFSGADPLPQQKTFVTTYVRNYGALPDMYDALGYDDMMLASKAIASVKNPSPKDGLQFAKGIQNKTIPGAMVDYHFKNYVPGDPNNEHTAITLSNLKFMKAVNGNFQILPNQPNCATP